MAAGDVLLTFTVDSTLLPNVTVVGVDAFTGTFDVDIPAGCFVTPTLAGTLAPAQWVGTFDIDALEGIHQIDPMEGTFT